MTRRSVRLAAVAALAVLAFPLAGCETNQGTAAYVGDTRITEDELNSQIDAFYADPYWGKQVKGSDRNAIRKRTMRALVLREIFKGAKKNENLTVPEGDVKKLAEEYKKDPQKVPEAFQGAPSQLLAEIFAVVGVLQQKVSAAVPNPDQASAAFDAILRKSVKDNPIEVNPRYGTFTVEGYTFTPRKDAGVRDLPVSPPPLPTGENAEQQPQQGQEQPPQEQPQEQPPN